MRYFAALLLGSILFFSCKKNDSTPAFRPQLISITDSAPVYNYFLLRSTQLADSTDNTVQTQALATFLDQNGNAVPIHSISINGREMGHNSNNTLSINYIDSANLLQEGKAFAGTSVRVSIAGDDASDTATRFVYLPKRLVDHSSQFLDSPIHAGTNIPLTWNTDAMNSLGVTIQVIYDAATSVQNNPLLPTQLDPITYRVADSGKFTIPGSDLLYFPIGSFVSVRIARVSEIKNVLPGSKKVVYYWGISDISSPSVFINAPVQ